MVAGFEKFKEHFGAFQDEFIIIGGTAVQLVRGESDHTRVTRDIDLLVVAERMWAEFSGAFHAFLSAASIGLRRDADPTTRIDAFRRLFDL